VVVLLFFYFFAIDPDMEDEDSFKLSAPGSLDTWDTYPTTTSLSFPSASQSTSLTSVSFSFNA